VINAEVRLYYKTRTDWDTIYFTATSSTDLFNKAKKIAEEHHADHSNCGVATAEGKSVDVSSHRVPRFAAPPSVKEQVELIEKAIGRENGTYTKKG
jgi:hypothetical protein